MAEPTYTAIDEKRPLKKRLSIPYTGKWAVAYEEIFDVAKAAQEMFEFAAARKEEPSAFVLVSLAKRLRRVADQLEGK